jgi:hypothetical protein
VTEAEDREMEEEARSLLSAVQAPEMVPAAVKARALRRLTLAIPGPGAGGAPAAPAPGGQGSTGPAAQGIGRALATRVPAWSLLLSFVAGGALATVRPRTEAPSTGHGSTTALPVAAPSVIVTAAVPAEVEAPTATAATAEAKPSAPAPALRAAASATGRAAEGALEAERAVLDVARTALGRGDGSNALRATAEHARKYPRGALAEEREAMAIQALRLLHRDDEAEARLGRFRGRFPTSLIRPALEADAGGAP